MPAPPSNNPTTRIVAVVLVVVVIIATTWLSRVKDAVTYVNDASEIGVRVCKPHEATNSVGGIVEFCGDRRWNRILVVELPGGVRIETGFQCIRFIGNGRTPIRTNANTDDLCIALT